MFVKNVEVYNFRCHEKYQANFSASKTLIQGLNGSGKTSLIEAIYVLLRGKSFRGNDSDMLKFATDWYKIKINIKINDKIESRELRFEYYKNKTKSFLINQQKYQRLSNQKKIPVILFQPDDLNLISGSPSRRRRFFDNIITQLKPEHNTYLLRYEKALRQRNNLIKNFPEASKNDLFSWNVMLANYGAKIIQNRLEIIEIINQEIENMYKRITSLQDKIKLKYPEKYQNQTQIEAELFHKNSSELILSTGPQRDDFILEFNQNLANRHASRGETRSLVLSLKMIEAELIQKYFKQKPIILLDDVLSELDDSRRSTLLSHISHNQIIMTSTEAINLGDTKVINI